MNLDITAIEARAKGKICQRCFGSGKDPVWQYMDDTAVTCRECNGLLKFPPQGATPEETLELCAEIERLRAELTQVSTDRYHEECEKVNAQIALRRCQIDAQS